MKILTHLLVSTLAILITDYILQGASVTILSAVVLAVVLGVINIFIKPIVKMITLPITVVTLGFFSLVVNALFVLLSAKIVPGFTINGFWSAFWFSIVLSLVSALFNKFRDDE
ncbi:MAG TPA: phage holin family protein [Parcubacteria group bacterium]|jgi:putative membrane protein|nr:phage holin family protein [Parcubacteria group bacterium]